MKRTFERIFIHTTDADYNKIPRQFFAVDNWHKDKFGIYWNKEGERVSPSTLNHSGGYTTLIEPDGSELRYREDWEETMAVLKWNRKSLSTALAFDGDIQLPTPKQVVTLMNRIRKWSVKYNIPLTKVYFVGPHRLEAPHKTCYGALLADDWALKLMNSVKKDADTLKKKEVTEADNQIISALRTLILQLKIFIGMYIKSINKRSV